MGLRWSVTKIFLALVITHGDATVCGLGLVVSGVDKL